MFLETVCIDHGKVQHLRAHTARMQQTAAHFRFTAPALPHLEMLLPPELNERKVKCSIIYHTAIERISFDLYQPKQIRTRKLVAASPDYACKFADRAVLNNLLLQKGDCDEILICRDGFITDTSYSNVVFQEGSRFFTPRSYLLNGTKRQLLLRSGSISEREISTASLGGYDRVYLINAMLDIEDGISLPVSSIYP